VLIVFDYRRPARAKFQQAPGTTYVLGLLRGHWDHDSEYPPLDASVKEEMERLNLGIAIVTPIQYLTNLLYREDLVNRRRAVENEYRDRDAVTLDHAEALAAPVAPGPEPKRLAVEGDWPDAVGRALRKGKPPKGRRRRRR
jgi:hypothetical protein